MKIPEICYKNHREIQEKIQFYTNFKFSLKLWMSLSFTLNLTFGTNFYQNKIVIDKIFSGILKRNFISILSKL